MHSGQRWGPGNGDGSKLTLQTQNEIRARGDEIQIFLRAVLRAEGGCSVVHRQQMSSAHGNKHVKSLTPNRELLVAEHLTIWL